ncbi:MAG TPA: amino acid ABC transporter permease [Dermatophilaceae bacterium]|nr:amino acid ABC transporter permease [Dermatophilaceae bacterium]
MNQAVLFDNPGPRAVRRHKVIAVVTALAALGVLWLVLVKLGEKGNLAAAKWTPFLAVETWTEYIVPGLLGTLKAAAISIVLAGVLGLLLGIGRLSEVAAIRWVSSVVVEFFRSVPVLLMMLFSFALYSFNNVFPSEQLSLAAVVTGLTLYNGAVIAELVRAGVGNLPNGQREAGLSIGLTPGQTLWLVQLPQALTAMLPAIVGQLVVVLKDSALGQIITYEELLNKAGQIGTSKQDLVPAFIVVAVIFIVINYLLTRLAVAVEQRINRRGHTSGTTPAAPGQAPITEPERAAASHT